MADKTTSAPSARMRSFSWSRRVVLELFISAGNPPRVSFPEAYGLRHVAFRVEDATAARETLIRKGYAPQELRHDTFTGDAMFFVMDPDGLPVEIHE